MTVRTTVDPAPAGTADLAEFVTGTTFDGLPEDVLAAAIPPIVDTIGALLGGYAGDAGRSALAFAEAHDAGAGAGVIVGSTLTVPAETAALVNATLAHALDFDDVMSGVGHVSGLLLGALLGMGGGAPLSGRRLVEAYVVGHEVTVRVARALGKRHYPRGWHVTCTAGTLGATAATAKLLGMNTVQVRTALGAAASMAGGLQRNFGTTTKPLHSGFAARNGVLATQLVACGLSAAGDVLDGPKGFLDMFGEGAQEPQALELLGRPFALIEPGVDLKRYACCHATHRGIDAVLQLQAEHRYLQAELESISARMPTGAMLPLIYSDPMSGLQAKFSAEYTLAAAFLDRDMRLDTFSDEAVLRPAIRDLLTRIDVREDPACRPEDPLNVNSIAGHGGFVEITVRARGEQHVVRVDHPTGAAVHPMSRPDLAAKLADCMAYGGRDTSRASQLFDRLIGMATEPDVHALLAEL